MSQTIAGTHNVDVWETQDIGGTDFWTVGAGANAGWVSMEEYDTFCAYVEIGGTWNAADALDDLYLQQATDATGTGAKAASVAKDISQTAANSAGETFSLECQGDELDVDNGFTYVRCYIAESDNTGVDNVSQTYIRTTCRYANDNESGCTDYV